jgi:[NiFe] hydrogenase assembly HybE family chaperone
VDIGQSVAELVAHFRRVHSERMQGMPIINPALEVAAIDFRGFEEHAVGALISPWFMNLIVLPGTEEWNSVDQGDVATISLPGGEIDFNVTHDDCLGTYLTAALFSSVADFPDQDVAEAIAKEIICRLFEPEQELPETETQRFSRRELFTRLDAG